MATSTKKATGIRGSWFARVDGELLPCVHAFWTSPSRDRRLVYDDPGVAPGQPKADELAAALRKTGLAILTTDKGDPRTGGAFERTGYVAVFAVKDVEFDERGLRFEFVKRLVDLA